MNKILVATSIAFLMAASGFAAPKYGEPLNDSRNGKTYKTVVIGDQVWMAENLNFKTKNSFCYEDSESNCETYGRFYTWTAAMKLKDKYEEKIATSVVKKRHQGVCLDGWHIPDADEWDELLTFVGAGQLIEKEDDQGVFWAYEKEVPSLKSKNLWNGTDKYGFNLLPAGLVEEGESFSQGKMAIYWLPEDLQDGGLYLLLTEDGAEVSHEALSIGTNMAGEVLKQPGAKTSTGVVRCLKN